MVRNPGQKRLLGRPMHRWEDKIKTDLKKIGLEGVHYTDLAQDRNKWQVLVKKVMNFHNMWQIS